MVNIGTRYIHFMSESILKSGKHVSTEKFQAIMKKVETFSHEFKSQHKELLIFKDEQHVSVNKLSNLASTCLLYKTSNSVAEMKS